MNTYTKVMSEAQMMALKAKLNHGEICKTPPYAIYRIKTSECTITAYASGKVTFQGKEAAFYAENCAGEMKEKKEKKAISAPSLAISYPQCGSDEVGTGDYFGPVVVCAACVEEKDLNTLSSLQIQDSKQLKDEHILQIAPILMETLTYSVLVLENAKYNHVHETNNIEAIKAKLHNQAFVHLKNKMQHPCDNIIIDQFAPPERYYRYLQEEKEVIRNIHFETKAENKYIAVACGAIIARYTFLKALEAMGEKYDFDFPKGAGKHVDEAGVLFVEKFGMQALHKVSKFHFKNTQKIIEFMK